MKITLPIKVVGGKHHRMAEAGDMKLLAVGGPLILRREPSNKYDPFAIQVFVTTPPPEGQEMQIGYVAGFQSRQIANSLDTPGVVFESCSIVARSGSSLSANLVLDNPEVADAPRSSFRRFLG